VVEWIGASKAVGGGARTDLAGGVDLEDHGLGHDLQEESHTLEAHYCWVLW
jgi:hypothetical protein